MMSLEGLQLKIQPHLPLWFQEESFYQWEPPQAQILGLICPTQGAPLAWGPSFTSRKLEADEWVIHPGDAQWTSKLGWPLGGLIRVTILCHIKTHVVVVEYLNHVQLFVTLWTAALQASLSFTTSWSLLKLISIDSVMPSNHLILCQLFASFISITRWNDHIVGYIWLTICIIKMNFICSF